MLPKPLVSVIVPVYNRFPEADRAILSVINQSYENWELIIIDDCSTEEYHYKRTNSEIEKKVTLIRNQVNLGPGLSRQVGINVTSGDYICFLDSDDYYHRDFLLKSLEVHKENPESSATYCTSQYIQTGLIRENSNSRHANIIPNLFEFNRPWATCSLLWKRKYIAKWSSLRTNQDSLFELECAIINNSIDYVPFVLCYIDKGTGMNTADLVRQAESDLHRCYVARYALKNIALFQIDGSKRGRLSQAVFNRIVYVSSKLAGHGMGLEIVKNAFMINNKFNNFKLFSILILVGLISLAPSKYLRKIGKGLLSRIIQQSQNVLPGFFISFKLMVVIQNCLIHNYFA